MKKLIWIIAISLLCTAGIWYFAVRKPADVAESYIFGAVSRGDLRQVISSTGTLTPQDTVDVGTQVSGIVSKIFVDFNSLVHEGQLIARLDTSELAINVLEQQAAVSKAKAELDEARDNLARGEELYSDSMIAKSDLISAQTSMTSAVATLNAASASLALAKINLERAEIRSPIDGIVIKRSVNEGQTVAASLSAPVLFTIARDLSKMQILAQVDESDIGMIHVDQPVTFTVAAYPDRTIRGSVRQLRLQPEAVQNVVNYTVVINTDNPDQLLLPGMTATVDFVVQEVKDILLVPSGALRIQPTAAMQKLLVSRGGGSADPPRRPGGRTTQKGGQADTSKTATLWYVDETGAPEAMRVTRGITDGMQTEVSGEQLKEGMQIIAGVKQPAISNSAPIGRRRLF